MLLLAGVLAPHSLEAARPALGDSRSVASVGSIAAGGQYTCQLKADGCVVCWGDEVLVLGPQVADGFTQVSLGNRYTCGIKADGSVACQGDNHHGEAPRVSVSPVSLPPALIHTAYSQSLGASSGTAPYTFSVRAGELASGLTLSPTGLLHGTPTQPGTFHFTVHVADASSFTTFTSDQDYTVVVRQTMPVFLPITVR